MPKIEQGSPSQFRSQASDQGKFSRILCWIEGRRSRLAGRYPQFSILNLQISGYSRVSAAHPGRPDACDCWRDRRGKSSWSAAGALLRPAAGVGARRCEHPAADPGGAAAGGGGCRCRRCGLPGRQRRDEYPPVSRRCERRRGAARPSCGATRRATEQLPNRYDYLVAPGGTNLSVVAAPAAGAGCAGHGAQPRGRAGASTRRSAVSTRLYRAAGFRRRWPASCTRAPAL